jgi:glycyl-tRNA synthetase beta chain
VAELLLEILSEEIPARMQARAADDLKRLVTDSLKKAGLIFEGARSFVTPRRLALVVDGLPVNQPDVTEERRGPRVDAPEQAIQGFLKGNGLALDQCEKRTTPKGEFFFAVVERKGQVTADLLPEMFNDIFQVFPWPKSMRWGTGGQRWVRPLHGILCLFDGAVVPMAVGSTKSTNSTIGHRVLAPGVIGVNDFAEYRDKLEKAQVILDADERRKAIVGQAEVLTKKEKLTVKIDNSLLAEVTGLVEWPMVLMGRIDEVFMDLPEEVLTTAMRHHQKYFSVVDAKGRLAPRFIAVANTEAMDDGKAIIAGNERVLRARLADARYFWDQDRKRTLESRVADLDGIVFQQRLGTVLYKAERMTKLASALAETIGADSGLAERAAHLAKADLTAEMVTEFPELQGVMGRYYALADGEPAKVAEAIADHYAPQGPADCCPSAPVSVAVALADKIDSLVGFWGVAEKPTGSKDPFALRRAALGVIRLIVENGLRVPLLESFTSAHGFFLPSYKGEPFVIPAETLAKDLLDFFADRLKVHLRDKGVRHDLVTAVFSLGGEDDLVRLLARVEALETFLASDDGESLLVAYKRAANIVAIEEKKDGVTYDQPVDAGHLSDAEEVSLHAGLEDAVPRITNAVAEERFADAMAALAGLRAPVDAFFDKVTVNCDDQTLRANRLRLLSRIRGALGGVADFSKIEG